MKKMLLSVSLICGMTAASAALADYSLVCGKGREHGPEKAELALVQNNETLEMRLYVDGKELAKGSFIANGAPENKWNVTVFDRGGDPKLRYEFREKPAEVQAYEPGPALRKQGEVKKCILTDTDPVPAPPAPEEGKSGALKSVGKKISRN